MKKFSKKLFCLMLVAIMVATAIPFGAFAETVDVPGPITVQAICGDDAVVATGKLPALSNYDHTKDQAKALLYGDVTLEGYTLDASTPSELVDSTDQKILKVFVTKDPEYSVVVTGDATATGANKLETIDAGTPKDYGKLYQAMTDAGLSEYLDTDKWTITKAELADKVLTVTVAKKDEAPAAPAQVDFTVTVTTGGSTEIVSGTAKMTKAAAEALSTNAAGAKTILNAMKDVNSKFGTCADAIDADASVFNSMVVNTTSNTITVNLTKDPTVAAPSTPSSSDDIEVEIQIDNRTPYTRTVTIGKTYMRSDIVGLSGDWGNVVDKVYIYDNNGNRREAALTSADSNSVVKRGDVKVVVKSKLKTIKVIFLKDETCAANDSNNVVATRELYWGDTFGTLPALPNGYGSWYIGSKKLSADTVYDWEIGEKDKDGQTVYARPILASTVNNGKVHLFVYNASNKLMKDFDVTSKVQTNGLLFLEDLKSTIKSQTGVSSFSSEGLMDETGWAYYINNKNSYKYAKSSIDVDTADQREGVQNVYVVLKNVSSGSNADTSNPKTGDTAMIGTAAIVMALAAVGMGTAFYMKKKELF